MFTAVLWLLACSTAPDLLDSETGQPADTIEEAPDATFTSCSRCTDNGDGTVTLHVYPPQVGWSADVSSLSEDSTGLFNSNPSSGVLEASVLLEVEAGDRLIWMEADFDLGGQVLIRRDPQLIPPGTDGSTPWVGGGGTAVTSEQWDLEDLIIEAGVDYYAVLMLTYEQPPRHLERLDILIDPAP